MLAGCGLFLDNDDFPDPCAEEDDGQTCQPGSAGYTCGKKNDACHEYCCMELFAPVSKNTQILPGSRKEPVDRFGLGCLGGEITLQ